MRRYGLHGEGHPHPSSYRSYHNSDINQLFHSIRDSLNEPFTITDIDLVVEQHRQFRGLIEIKDNGITHWHPRQYITYRELAHALQLPHILLLNRVRVHEHYRLYVVPTTYYPKEPIPLEPHLYEEGGPEVMAEALREVLFGVVSDVHTCGQSSVDTCGNVHTFCEGVRGERG